MSGGFTRPRKTARTTAATRSARKVVWYTQTKFGTTTALGVPECAARARSAKISAVSRKIRDPTFFYASSSVRSKHGQMRACDIAPNACDISICFIHGFLATPAPSSFYFIFYLRRCGRSEEASLFLLLVFIYYVRQMSRAALGGKPICSHYPHARAWSPVVRIPARSRAVVVAAAQPPAPAARPPCPPPWGRRLPRQFDSG